MCLHLQMRRKIFSAYVALSLRSFYLRGKVRPDSGTEGRGAWGSPPHSPTPRSGEEDRGGGLSRKEPGAHSTFTWHRGVFWSHIAEKNGLNDSLEVFMTHANCGLYLHTQFPAASVLHE